MGRRGEAEKRLRPQVSVNRFGPRGFGNRRFGGEGWRAWITRSVSEIRVRTRGVGRAPGPSARVRRAPTATRRSRPDGLVRPSRPQNRETSVVSRPAHPDQWGWGHGGVGPSSGSNRRGRRRRQGDRRRDPRAAPPSNDRQRQVRPRTPAGPMRMGRTEPRGLDVSSGREVRPLLSLLWDGPVRGS